MDTITNSPAALALRNHFLLQRMQTGSLTLPQLSVVLSQWYHPLHHFPDFLSHHIASAPGIAPKTAISRILWQELGEGEPRRAHENLFITTLQGAGIDTHELLEASTLPATQALIDAYNDSREYLESLGYLFATESIDLPMVSALGAAIRRVTGTTDLPWVDIHVRQEPDHTDSAGLALEQGLSAGEARVAIEAAHAMFHLWVRFFDGIAAAFDTLPEPVLRSIA